jgi:ABC-type polysaccharide/polyol phosphate export permease
MRGSAQSWQGKGRIPMERMQRYQRNKTHWEAALSFLDLLYVSIVREFRTENGGAIMSFFSAIAQPLLIFLLFYLIYEVVGRAVIVRGDFLLFMMTGIMMYLMHIKAVTKLRNTSHSMKGMIFYAKASTILSIMSAALYQLYLNILAIIVIMGTSYLIRGHLEVYNPSGLLLPFFFAWASGLAAGMMFMALTPVVPWLMPRLWQFYRRLQMFSSGKMLLGNMVPAGMLPFFQWNPLFHCIDQARGEAFINYLPRNSNMTYPVYFTIALLVLGLLIEFAVRANQDRGIE